MGKLIFSSNKSLKLNNVLKCAFVLDNGKNNFEVNIEQMKSYLRIKGTVQKGPLIQYIRPFVNDVNELDMEISMLMQCEDYIHTVEYPYQMESILRITNCLYCRYIGPEENLKFAYDKIYIEAFENNISLKGDSYTIYLESNLSENNIIADVFMPKED